MPGQLADARYLAPRHHGPHFARLGQAGLHAARGRQRDFARDYNPPARLGTIYRLMKKYDESLAAYDRALKLA